MGYGIKVKVWGDYACFSRPELKVERVSYDFITPSAAKGILEAIYWKPAIKWQIDKIHIINPIKFTNMRRNEVQEVAKLPNIKKSMEKSVCYDISAPDMRHQRAAMILRNVEYVIEAHFDINIKNAGETDTPEKHYNIAIRRLRQGQYFQKPFLGTREFPANFEIIEKEEDIPKSRLVGEQDFGYMLCDINYQLDSKKEKISVSPTFFRAVAINGIVDLTKAGEVVS
ncbi:CRISPR pre-crRNA endoribonuclease Cas5d [bioreactor metagenome]|uniref:CRISPR pre-crRNA endoribonuclease Cas5d n=1 Tax=bioreactor metagenome TaxID=1076179 RepID=A0A645AFU7_9ZZZZ|nr:type I-C CRISPR-associated protein Cas5c [Lachnospiraceae bacterium]